MEARKRIRMDKDKSGADSSSGIEIDGLDLLQRLSRCSSTEWMSLLVENSHHFRNTVKTLQNICGNSPVFRIHLELVESESGEGEPLPLFYIVMDSKSVDRTAFAHFMYPIHSVSINEELMKTKMSTDGLMVDMPLFCVPLDKLSHALNSVGDSKLITLKLGNEDSMEKMFVRGFLDPSSLKSARSDLWSIPLVDLTTKIDETRRRMESVEGKKTFTDKDVLLNMTRSFPVERLNFIFQVHRLDFGDMLSMLRDDTSKEATLQIRIFKFREENYVFERIVSNSVAGTRRENRIMTKIVERESPKSSSSSSTVTFSNVSIEKNATCMTSSDEDYFELEGFKPAAEDVLYDYKFSSSTLESLFKHIQKTDDFSIMFAESGQMVMDINRTVIGERRSGLFILLQPRVEE